MSSSVHGTRRHRMLLCHLTGDVNLDDLVPVVSPHHRCHWASVIDKHSARRISQDCVTILSLTTFHPMGFCTHGCPLAWTSYFAGGCKQWFFWSYRLLLYLLPELEQELFLPHLPPHLLSSESLSSMPYSWPFLLSPNVLFLWLPWCYTLLLFLLPLLRFWASAFFKTTASMPPLPGSQAEPSPFHFQVLKYGCSSKFIFADTRIPLFAQHFQFQKY